MKNFMLGFLLFSLKICYGCSPLSVNLFEPVVKHSVPAPTYPLITIDPYTSAWSFTNRRVIVFINYFIDSYVDKAGLPVINSKFFTETVTVFFK